MAKSIIQVPLTLNIPEKIETIHISQPLEVLKELPGFGLVNKYRAGITIFSQGEQDRDELFMLHRDDLMTTEIREKETLLAAVRREFGVEFGNITFHTQAITCIALHRQNQEPCITAYFFFVCVDYNINQIQLCSENWKSKRVLDEFYSNETYNDCNMNPTKRSIITLAFEIRDTQKRAII
ncbi:hypothetical protein N7540_012498 [Penicillium herquei]|nr:hypothetical protein N7540_012498 [Penicillium herquei]